MAARAMKTPFPSSSSSLGELFFSYGSPTIFGDRHASEGCRFSKDALRVVSNNPFHVATLVPVVKLW
jgi:hypothetical protein